jgi:hypothetical protein
MRVTDLQLQLLHLRSADGIAEHDRLARGRGGKGEMGEDSSWMKMGRLHHQCLCARRKTSGQLV